LVEVQPLMLNAGRLNVEVDDTHFLSEQAAAKRFADPRTAPGDQTDPLWHCLSFVMRLNRFFIFPGWTRSALVRLRAPTGPKRYHF
jgi:hypothetical protein